VEPNLAEPIQTVAARLDRLPRCGFHRRFILLVSLGTWFDVFDIFMMAYLGAAMQDSHFLTLHQFTHLIAAGFLGMFIGTVVFGMGSDYFGRRTSFVVMLLVYSVFTLLGALAPNPPALIVLRVLAGIGIGAELVVVDTYVSEMVPSHARGRYVAITQFLGFTSIPVAALLARLLVPTHWLMAGWRWVMVIGSAGALFAWYLRRGMPESPRWLESRGRHDEAARIMNSIEHEVMSCTGRPLPGRRGELNAEARRQREKNEGHMKGRLVSRLFPFFSVPLYLCAESSPAVISELPTLGTFAAETGRRMPFRDLWQPPYRGRTLMLVVFHLLQTVGLYGFANWAPTFLLRQGHNLERSLQYGFLIALVSPVGPLIAVLTADRLERKHTIVVLTLLMAATGLCFAFAVHAVAIVTIGAALTIFSYWFSALLHAYQAELFPTRARATGVGFTYSWSRLSAVLSTLIIGALLGKGILAVFLFIAAAMVGVALLVGLLGPRTNAVALEYISH